MEPRGNGGWMERLWTWKERTDQRLREKWWLWPLVFVIELVWHHIYETTNEILASHGGPFFRTIGAVVMAVSPYLLAVLLSLLIIVGLAVHAYFDVRRGAASASVLKAVETEAIATARLAEAKDEGARVRQLGDLKDAILDCARRFEALSLAYEQRNLEATSEESEKIRKAREAYLGSIHGVIREAIASIPAERQGEYRDILKYLLVDPARYSLPVTHFSKALGPMSPIEAYLYPPEPHD